MFPFKIRGKINIVSAVAGGYSQNIISLSFGRNKAGKILICKLLSIYLCHYL